MQLDHGTWALCRISIPRAEVERQRGAWAADDEWGKQTLQYATLLSHRGVFYSFSCSQPACQQPRLSNPHSNDAVDFASRDSTDGVCNLVNPNQWGWNEGDPGKLCMNVRP